MLISRRTLAICLISGSAIIAAASSAEADAFNDNFHSNCVKHAVTSMQQKGVQVDAPFQKKVNDYCDCGLAGVTQQFTQPELQALIAPNPDEALLARVKPIMMQCYQANFQQ